MSADQVGYWPEQRDFARVIPAKQRGLANSTQTCAVRLANGQAPSRERRGNRQTLDAALALREAHPKLTSAQFLERLAADGNALPRRLRRFRVA